MAQGYGISNSYGAICLTEFFYERLKRKKRGAEKEMPIWKFDRNDVKFTSWKEIFGVDYPGNQCTLFTKEQSPKIGATIESWGPAPPQHWINDYDEAWYMISGSMIVESEGKRYEYREGDFGIATKGEYTLWVPDYSKGMVAFVVHCPPLDSIRDQQIKRAKEVTREKK